MTERSPAERPTACPFLAFDEDRDFRADRPDHRHRCFAEPRPAARAISHQELFCLGGAFAECPTFAAWAAREAAAVRRPTIRRSETARPVTGAPPVDRETPAAGVVGAAGVAAAAAPAERDWLAPPPWVADARPVEADIPVDIDEGSGAEWDEAPAGIAPVAQPPSHGMDTAGGPHDLGEAPPFLAARDGRPVPGPTAAGTEADDDLGGLVGTAGVAAAASGSAGGYAAGAGATGASAAGAGAPAGDATWAPVPAGRTAPQPVSGRASSPPPSGYTSAAARAAAEQPEGLWIHPDSLDPGDDEHWEDAVEAAAAARVARSRRDDDRGRSVGSRFGLGRSRPATAGQARPQPERAADPSAPAWERPRRFDSYPPIKKTRRSYGLPRVAVWAGLLLAAALVLFLVPPFLLGGGGGGSSSSPTPSASADGSLAPSPTPTPIPQPTPFTYKVKAGDTLSGIAAKYKVPVEDILAANPDLKDPNRLQIGQAIVIPLPVSSVIPDAGTPTASAAP